jgi:predicted RNA-binding protein
VWPIGLDEEIIEPAMCLAKVYLNKQDDEPILRDVALVRLHNGQVEMETLFGEVRVVSARLVEVDFNASRILLEESGESGDSRGGASGNASK